MALAPILCQKVRGLRITVHFFLDENAKQPAKLLRSSYSEAKLEVCRNIVPQHFRNTNIFALEHFRATGVDLLTKGVDVAN